MTITTQTDCTTLTVTDTQLVGTNTSVKLTVTVNCQKEYVLTYATNLTSLVITPTQLEMEDTVSDGVYTIKLEIVKSDSSTYSTTLCHLVDCSLSCTVENSYTKTDKESLKKVLAYNALKLAQSCYACNCETLCLFLNIIKNPCNNELSTNNDCGCH